GPPHLLPVTGTMSGEAALGGDDHVLRVRVQHLAQQVLAHEGAVRVGGVDEVHAQLGQAGERALGFGGVLWVAPDARAGDAHGAEAKAVDRQVAADEEGAAGGGGWGGHGDLLLGAGWVVPATSRV